MMTWNYRIVRENIGTRKEPVYHYGIYEVYYSKAWNPVAWSADVQKAEAYHTLKEFKQQFNMMRQALGRWVLEMRGKKNKKLIPLIPSI